MTLGDHDLLRAYACEGSESSFAELVRRHLDLVYSAARRQVRSPDLAQDVAQSVFVDLARNASALKPDQPLAAWLFLVTRRTAIDVIRRESRRQIREQVAAEISAMSTPTPPWTQIEPLLDEAVESLPKADRAAIILRFFENKNLRDIGDALGASEDAAQKRVSRAVEQLRTFFLRRGIAITAAGLAIDLSAQAVNIAPAGLGASIATAANAASHVTLHSAATTLAMTTTQKIGVAAAVVAAAVTVYEAGVIYRQQATLETARAEATALATEVAGLRAARKSDADRLKLVQAQLNARLAQAAATAPAAGDTALESQMRTWLAQLEQLKHFLSDQPRFNIPELQFLSDQDWFAIAAGGQLNSNEDFRRASAALRNRAEGIFNGKISRALSAYIRANDDQLPENPHQLATYFDPPVDSSLLDRYEMLQHGKAGDVPRSERMKIVTTRTPVDIEYDVYNWAGIDGYGNNGSIMGYNLGVAQRAFRRANPGEEPTVAERLLPYLKWPVDVVVLQKYIDREKSGGSR